METNHKILCETQGGSHAYGLSTPASDVDIRGVFANTELGTIIGINRHDHQVKQDEKEDSAFWEVREFLRLLRGGNTQAVELIFTDKWIEVDPAFVTIKFNRSKLLDSSKLVKVLKGYAQSELRLANGERTGKLGGKRKVAIDQFGYSPKNFVQLFRLLWAGKIFYQSGIFPVYVPEWDPELATQLVNIKTQPENFRKEQLNELAKQFEAELDEAYSKTTVKYKFYEQAANEICLEVYAPLLEKYGIKTR